ncbi:hypothetical protein JMUB3870_2417 [Leptotrichia trevisanii]|uniref:Uncharacterized protein n=1 Tax=Leptotrichia trevisanii TaxID=109328 RepID=A0A510K3P0_9FUSO|nr:hypothetical protein JMUB3870_2417 [Leptotrichia trevisanii]
MYWRNYETKKNNEKFNVTPAIFLLSDWKLIIHPVFKQYFLLYFKISNNEQGN